MLPAATFWLPDLVCRVPPACTDIHRYIHKTDFRRRVLLFLLQIHRVLNRWYRFRLLRGHAAGILPQWVNCHPTDRSRICMDIIWQYSSKANSSNVHDFLLIIGTVLNLVKKMYSSTYSSSILCLVVCVQLYPGRSEASCQIPALAFFISGSAAGAVTLDKGKLATIQFDYLQCVRKKVLWYRYPLYLLRNSRWHSVQVFG